MYNVDWKFPADTGLEESNIYISREDGSTFSFDGVNAVVDVLNTFR